MAGGSWESEMADMRTWMVWLWRSGLLSPQLMGINLNVLQGFACFFSSNPPRNFATYSKSVLPPPLCGMGLLSEDSQGPRG